MAPTLAIVLLAGGLAAVHLLAGRLRFLQVIPRSQYLSMAGGVSVAYVFGHLLPEITEHQSKLAAEGHTDVLLSGIASEHTLFLVALLGFTVFYGLERFIVRRRRRTDGRGVAPSGETAGPSDKAAGSTLAVWLHIGSFAVYNALIGYLLHRDEFGLTALILYVFAIALHFVVNDHGLREHHRDMYTHRGRWILAAAVLGGVFAGFVLHVPHWAIGGVLAFIGGSVVLNVIKEELPEERESSFPAFGAGVGGYTLVLLLI